jgi:hypothetical protein
MDQQVPSSSNQIEIATTESYDSSDFEEFEEKPKDAKRRKYDKDLPDLALRDIVPQLLDILRHTDPTMTVEIAALQLLRDAVVEFLLQHFEKIASEEVNTSDDEA